MEIRPGVYSYGVDWGYDEPLGVHVVETDAVTVLFGGGTEACADDLVEIAREHDVDAVVAEHGDFDHYDGIPALREAVEDLTVAAPAGDAPELAEAGVAVECPVDAGETYGGIETIAAPGHTPDNMAYLFEDVLVAGDTVVGSDSIFAADGDWQGPLAPCTPEYNADDEQTRASVGRLADYDFEIVLLSHGENVTEGGRSAVDALVAGLD